MSCRLWQPQASLWQGLLVQDRPCGYCVRPVDCAGWSGSRDEHSISPPTILEQGLLGVSSIQAYDLEYKVGKDNSKAL
jgi:hypothetical protein